MFALLAAAAVASACVTPPCLAFNGYASWREFVVNRTCCQLCSPGHSCDGRVSTPCNISAGEYQPEAAQLKCLKAAVCDVGTWENVPTSPTSSRRCTPISTCDPLSQVETRQPTSTSDRICTCIDGWAGISQCFPCASLSVGCTTCNLSIASNSSTRVTCSDCIDGYSLDVTAGECIPCTVRDCLRCIAPGVCSKCIDGKRPVLGECACEDSRCAECTNESHCLRCTEPYVLSPITGKCNECTGEMVMVNGTCVAKSQTSTAASNNKSGSVSIYVVAGIVIAVAGGCLVLLLAVYKSVIKPRIAGRTAPVPPPRVATNAGVYSLSGRLLFAFSSHSMLQCGQSMVQTKKNLCYTRAQCCNPLTWHPSQSTQQLAMDRPRLNLLQPKRQTIWGCTIWQATVTRYTTIGQRPMARTMMASIW